MFSIHKFGLILLWSIGPWAAAETLWEPGRVVAVQQVSTPAKTPDPSCRAVPKGTAPPAACRPANLRAEEFWRVTVDVGNKRFVVRPYRAPSVLESLNPARTIYIDPNLTVSSSVEVAVLSTKAVRIRTNQGQGVPAIVESQELLANQELPTKPKADLPPPPLRPRTTAPVASGSKVVLLENSDFVDLEVAEAQSQDIGDGALVYSFPGDSSPTRVGTRMPVFLVLAERESAAAGNVELSRLQVAKGNRQMAYSSARNRSASPVRVTVTQVSATVRKVQVAESLPPGEYVILLDNSSRGFLFSLR